MFEGQHTPHATLPQAPADLQVKYDELVQSAIQEGMTFSAFQLDWWIQLQTPESVKLLKNWNVFLKVLLLILIVADGACTFLHLNGWWLLLQLTHPFLDEADSPQKIYTSSRAFTCKSQSHMSFGEVTSPNTQVHCPGRTAQDCAPFLWLLVLRAL